MKAHLESASEVAIPPAGSSSGPRPVGQAAGGVGSRLVVALLILALGLAAFAVWFQWRQTRRCLAFYGAQAARSIQSAPRVELWRLRTDAATGAVVALDRTDVSAARGLVHLRRGLVEDANFNWSADPDRRRSAPEWDVAFAFFDSQEPAAAGVTVAIDLESPDHPGGITVVGRPGRAGLGRIGPGLRKWIEATLANAGLPAPDRE
jgi:hypothetical protein